MEHGGGHEIGAHKILELGGMQFHIDTLIMTWITMLIIAIVVIGCTRKLSVLPGGMQNFVEMLIEPIIAQVDSTVGKKGMRIIPVVVTVFLFVLFFRSDRTVSADEFTDRRYQHYFRSCHHGDQPCSYLWGGG